MAAKKAQIAKLDTPGARLKDAIRAAGYTIRGFADVVGARVAKEGRHRRGASYAYIHRYLKNELTPSHDFAHMAGAILGVRAQWLLEGTGGRTEAEHQRRQLDRPEAGTPDLFALAQNAHPWLLELPDELRTYATSAVLNVYMALIESTPPGTLPEMPADVFKDEDLSNLITNAVMDPLMYWIDLRGEGLHFDARAVADYVQLVSATLVMSARIGAAATAVREDERGERGEA